MKATQKTILAAVALAAVLVAGIGNPVMGQSKAGTTILPFLKIEPSARNAALGSASASMYGEALAAYYNPASLGRLPAAQAQFSHSQWLADIDYNFLIFATPLANYGIISLQAISLNSGEIDVTTVEQPLGTGERYTVNDFALGLAYGTLLTDRVSVGFQVNYMREDIWHSTVTAFGLNVGVQYRISDNGPTFGASISNFGPRSGFNGRDLYIQYDLDPLRRGDNNDLPAELRTENYALPTIFRVGISFPVRFGETNRLLIAVDASHPNDNQESLSMGAEWQIRDMFALRGGYRELFLEDSEGGLVLGGGLKLGLSGYNFRLDYAWADYGLLENTQRFTVGFEF
ncbi:MAG TPA: PorV/PorQ family protein [Calditrichia bacterium]|nr:PorV/PorQ family protein [Calditrichia bacterium]